ncbi:hypothetical protein BDP27DRAFT_1390112 [Rhodocollybia butyracea]|uniref:Small ribosomal subunit protein uS13m n=1 Tax=Rhodocollybia butyracea TaxID=206335 RepID=A0A9P5Q5J6_9AGAR|nr:hypothetical protein BDP27DRAFT_1390112 [Rhodocollybia butyracea]
MVHILGINLPDNQLARFALTTIYGVGHSTSHRLCARFQIHDTCRIRDLSPFQVTALASFLSSPQSAFPPRGATSAKGGPRAFVANKKDDLGVTDILKTYPLASLAFKPRPLNRGWTSDRELEREWENEVKEAKEQRERDRAAREREREEYLAEKEKKAKEKEEKMLTRLRGRMRTKVIAALAKHKATFKTRTGTTVNGRTTTTKSKPVQPKLPPKSLDPLANLTIETALRRLVRDNIAHQRMIGSYVGRRHAMGMPVRGQNTRSNAKTAKKMNRVDRWG